MAAQERRDISLAMFLLFSFGLACWIVYAIGIGSVPMIAANSITLLLALAILALKLRYTGKGTGAIPVKTPAPRIDYQFRAGGSEAL